jgi:hypothetical protein
MIESVPPEEGSGRKQAQEVGLRIQLVIAFLLGVIATLLSVIVFGHGPAPLYAQTIDSGGGGFVMGTSNYGEQGGKNMIWILNATERNAPHLALYEANAGRLSLVFERNVSYDFMFDQYPGREDSQSPSVSEVFRDTKKTREEGRTPTGASTPPPPPGK